MTPGIPFYPDPLYETITIGPPFKGLEQPFKGIYNPLATPGTSTTLNNWFIHQGNVLRLVDGYAEQGSGIAATRVKCITSYKSSGKNHLIFVAGKVLYYYDLASPATPPVAVVTMLASDTATRIAWVRFRNRFLFATMADGLWWYDPENLTARQAGVAVPASGPTLAAGAGGALTGTYLGWVSYVNDQGHESNLSASGTAVVAAQQIAWSAIPTGPAGTTKRNLYRSTAGNSVGLLLTTLADNSTTTFADNTADSALGSPNELNFTLPPTSIRNIAVQGTRVFLVDGADGITYWANKTDAATGLPNWEAFPSKTSAQYGFVGGNDAFKAITPIGQALISWGGLNGYRTLGDITGNSYTEALPWGIGLFSPFAWVLTADGLLFDGRSMPKYVGAGVGKQLGTANAGAGLDGPSMVYDQLNDCVHINYGTVSGQANNKTIIYYLKTDQASTSDFAFDLGYFSATDAAIYSSISGQTKIYITSGFKAAGTAFTGQTITYLPIVPVPGDKSYFIRLMISVKAQPIVSSVVPMLKVEYSLNGGAWFETKYVDVSKDFLVYSGGEAPVQRIVEVPIYKRAEALTIRISPAANSASVTNGQEIYGIFLHWQPSAEAKMAGRVFGSQGRLSTSTPSQ